jgi:iron complex outermembrane receptor protein
VNLYASWGIGFRSGGFNSLGSSDLLNFWFNDQGNAALPGAAVDANLVINDEYDKEVSSAFEVGMKTNWLNNRLIVNASLFNTDVDDNQFFEFFAGPFGILRVVTTIEEINIRGFETDFSYQMNDSIKLYGGAGFLDSEIERNNNRPLSVGNSVPQAPDFTSNLGVEFETEVGNAMTFFARADWQYVGETYFHTLQGEETPTIWQVFFPDIVTALGGIDQNFSKASRDAYDTLNLRVGLQGNAWALTAYGRNITDEEYLEEVIPAVEFGGSFNHQGVGAAYGVEFTYDF